MNIKPCPFCGDRGAKIKVLENTPGHVVVYCAWCEAEGPIGVNRFTAIVSWNVRLGGRNEAR
jgi:Lar family restriction alleviation protein